MKFATRLLFTIRITSESWATTMTMAIITAIRPAQREPPIASQVALSWWKTSSAMSIVTSKSKEY